MDMYKLKAIKDQIKIMHNQAFDNLPEDRLKDLSLSLYNALQYVPIDAIPKAFRDALDVPRRTKYPNAGTILQCYKDNNAGGPVTGFYDSRGSWTAGGAYYSIGNMPHWCKSHYLDKWQVDLWDKFKNGNCNENEIKSIKQLQNVKFFILKGPLQKNIDDWKDPEDYDIRDQWENEVSKY